MSLSEPKELNHQINGLVSDVYALSKGAMEKGMNLPISDIAVQQLLTAAVQLYAYKLQMEDNEFNPFDDHSVTATDVMLTVTKMLEEVDVELFELGLWQSWSKK